MQHYAMIWFKLISLMCKNKLRQKKNYKWETCWIKSIITSKLLPHIIDEKQCLPLFYRQPHGLPPIFTRKSESPFYDFLKISTPYK